jgi:broad specificity phosphatase PhoE
MPEQLLVIRAAPTAYDLAGRIRGGLAVPLAEPGVAAARAVAADLTASPPAAVYASRDVAALEAARIVAAACGLKPRRVEGLGNLDQGLWQGMLVEDIRHKQPRLYRQWQDNPWAVAPPEGELLEDACHRVAAALESIVRRHRGGRVAVVVPMPLDRIVRWIVSGRSMGDLWDGRTAEPACEPLPLAAQWRARPEASRTRQASG